jgi:rare lipoprotein A
MGHLSRLKRLAITLNILSLVIVWMSRISIAQPAEEGIANYYSDKFHGKKTASGEVYDKNGLTAAHKKHPYGTKLRVINLENQKSVVVTVNDRMRTGNPVVIDVTHRAAQDLGFVKAGKARVKVEVQ